MFALPTAARNAGLALAHTPAPASTSLLAASGLAMSNNVLPRANRTSASPAPDSPIMCAPRMHSAVMLPAAVFGTVNIADLDHHHYSDLSNRVEATLQQASTSAAYDMRVSIQPSALPFEYLCLLQNSTSFAHQQRNEFSQADDALRVSGHGTSHAAIRGSITTHTPLTASTYNYAAASTAYRLAQMQAFANDTAIERLGLGLSGLTLNQHNNNQNTLAPSGGLFNAQRIEMAPRSVTFAEDDEEIDDSEDGWEADTEMHSDVEDMLCEDFDISTGMEMPGSSQTRNRNRSSRNRPPTPYHAPNGESSWLSL